MPEERLRFFERYFTPREFRLPRIWSNRVLAELAPLFTGDVINVSGWKDCDKENRTYRTYFSKARSYSISNYGGETGESPDTTYHLDLEKPIPDELKGRFDVVFNHTTLEHIFDIFTAVFNLCALSKDIVIVVVPFIQKTHTTNSYSDYWRISANGLRELFRKNGFSIVYLESSPYSFASVYHVCVATKNPGSWKATFSSKAAWVNEGEKIAREPLWLRFILKIQSLFGIGEKNED